MRDRQQIESAIAAFARITSELDDNLTLVALGEDAGDDSIIAEAEASVHCHSGLIQSFTIWAFSGLPLKTMMVSPPPMAPVAAWRSMLCCSEFVEGFTRVSST